METAYQLHQAHYGPSRGYAKPHWIHTTVAVYTYDESKKTEGVKNKTTGYDYTKKQPKFVENKYPYGKPNPVTQLTTCIKIDQEKYAIKKAEKDEILRIIEDKKQLKLKLEEEAAVQLNNDKLHQIELLVEKNTLDNAISTFTYTKKNGEPYTNTGGRSTGSGGTYHCAFTKDGLFTITKTHSWSVEEMNGSCYGGGYDLTIAGKYFYNPDVSESNNVSGYITNVKLKEGGVNSVRERGGKVDVPDVHDFISGMYDAETETLISTFVDNPAKSTASSNNGEMKE